MRDQYGNKIPKDLVLLPDLSDLTDGEIEVIDNAQWYEANKILMASAREIQYLSEDDPIDAGIDLSKHQIYRVPRLLHGFYHA